jgi:transcriptional regulator with XRE-family HTH domain
MAIGPDGGTEIGSRIRGARTAKGWSQKRLAETLGVTQATVSHWEKSFTPPIAQTIAQIAEALEIEAGELLGDLADDRAIAPRPTDFDVAPTVIPPGLAILASTADLSFRAVAMLMDFGRVLEAHGCMPRDAADWERLEKGLAGFIAVLRK